MLVLEVNGEKKKCPVCWEEVTVSLYQRLKTEAHEGDHAVKVFSILTGTDFNKVWEAEAEDLEAAIYQCTAFVFNSPEEFRTTPVPKTFTLGGKSVLVPGKVGRLTVGQNFVLRGELSKAAGEGRPLESLLAIALAVYLQPLVDLAPFDVDRTRELEQEVLEMNVYDVFPVAFFLLSRLQSSGNYGIVFWLRPLILLWRTLQRKPRLKSSRPSMTCCSLIATLVLTVCSPGWSSRNPSTSSSPCFTSGRSATSTTSDSLMLRRD